MLGLCGALNCPSVPPQTNCMGVLGVGFGYQKLFFFKLFIMEKLKIELYQLDKDIKNRVMMPCPMYISPRFNNDQQMAKLALAG